MADAGVDALKAEANAEFAKESYLKAAALYTKAIKIDPTNAVLYRWGCVQEGARLSRGGPREHRDLDRHLVVFRMGGLAATEARRCSNSRR